VVLLARVFGWRSAGGLRPSARSSRWLGAWAGRAADCRVSLLRRGSREGTGAGVSVGLGAVPCRVRLRTQPSTERRRGRWRRRARGRRAASRLPAKTVVSWAFELASLGKVSPGVRLGHGQLRCVAWGVVEPRGGVPSEPSLLGPGL